MGTNVEGGGRLLLAGGDPSQTQALAAGLQGHGYEVTGAASGTEALAALRAGGYDALLADLALPGLEGLALLRAGLELDPNLAVLILAEPGRADQAVEALKLAWGGVRKPVELESLLPTLARALEARRLRLENAALREQLSRSESRVEPLFEESPISLWVEDFSEVKRRLAALRLPEGTDIGAYLAAHPEFVEECAALVKVLDVNRATVKLFGAKDKSELTQNLGRLLGPVGFSDFQSELIRIANGETSFAWEGFNYNLAGEGVYVHLHWSAAPGHQDDLSRVFISLIDLSERQRADQALRTSEARFAAMFQASPAAITVSTVEGRILDVNAEFERVTGYSRGEVLNRSALDLGLWAEPAERGRLVKRLAERGSLVGVEVQYRRRSGEIMYSLSSFELVELGGQQLIMTLALDITERKRAEDQMRFQAGLLGAVGQAVIATDLDGLIVFWNHMAERLYGWRSDEAIGQPLALILPSPTDAERVRETFARLRAGETWTGELEVQRRAGSTFPALVTVTPYTDRQGRLAGFISTSTDVSETKQRQREVEAIAQLNAALRGALTREQIMQVILDQLTDLLGATAGSLTTRDPVTGGTLVEMASGLWNSWAGTRSPAPEGIVSRVMATHEPYVTPSASTDPLVHPREAAEGIGAAAVMPLIAHGQLIGVLNLGRNVPFSESDVRLLRSVADITANAVQRAALHDQTRRRAEQLAAVNELARALGETLLLEQIHRRLEAATRHLLPAVSAVVISHFDAELQMLVDVYRADDGAQARPARDAGPAVDSRAIQAQAEVLQTRRPVIINPPEPSDQTPASVYAPLLAKGGVTGVLQARSASARFGPDEAELLATVANTAAVAIENAQLFAETQRRLLRLQSLRTIDLAITGSMDAQISLRVLVDQTAAQLNADAVDVLLLDKESHRLRLAAARGFRTSPRPSLRLDEGLAGQVFMERRLVRVPQLSGPAHDSARAHWLAAEGFTAYCGTPLLAKGLVRGVLEVFQRTPLAPDAEWVDFLETLAEQAAIAVDNSTLFSDLQRSNIDLELAYDTTLEGWSRALDLRDKETEGHTQRVTDLSERLARAMGLGDPELVHLRRGALLHDIGKMGIPDSILLKPGPLTEDEWTVMRRHPTYAFELLAPISYLRPAQDIPYCHHEKWDGTGYPRALAGEQIPLAARIFAVVDVWDALRSDRPYRPAWPEEQVRQHVRALAGQHFDPRVVQAFARLMGLD